MIYDKNYKQEFKKNYNQRVRGTFLIHCIVRTIKLKKNICMYVPVIIT